MLIPNTSFIPFLPPVHFGNLKFVIKVCEIVSALSVYGHTTLDAPDLVCRGFLEHCELSANLITQLD